jgi:monoamine oxidase
VLGGFYVEQRTPFAALDDWFAPAARQYDVSLAEWLTRQGASEAARRLINQSLGAPGLANVGVLRMLQEATRARAEMRSLEQSETFRGKDVFERAALLSSHVVGGTSILTDAMAQSLGDRVVLGQRVVAIDMDERGCEIRCSNDRRWRAHHVITAVPFSTLREVSIAPSLVGAQGDAVRRMPYGNQSQVWLRVKAPYWEVDGIEASMWTDGLFTLIRQQIEYDGRRELVAALSFGRNSQRLDALPEAERGRVAIEFIERVRPSTRGQLEFIGAHSWAAVPLIRGCSHGHLPWRGVEWANSMGRPHHRLHFAGEHVRRLEVGMEAAMESGERAALEILGV